MRTSAAFASPFAAGHADAPRYGVAVHDFPHYSPLSLRLSDEPDPAWKVHAIAVNRKAAGEDVIVLSIGEPDSPPPAVPARPNVVAP